MSNPKGLKVLIVGGNLKGGGGREAVIAAMAQESPTVAEIFCFTDNPTIRGLKKFREVPIEAGKDIESLAGWADANDIDLTIVGPEAPLAAGIVNVFQEYGLAIFGPTKEAAVIESSKYWAKEMMRKANVPTAEANWFYGADKARDYIRNRPREDSVIKCDGLKAGKGVDVCDTREEAIASIEKFAAEGEINFLIEERLWPKAGTGSGELSYFAIVDSYGNFKLFESARDNKRRFDGDKGLNTGGMGAEAPASNEIPGTRHYVSEIIVRPILNEMIKNQTPFTGILYIGLMITKDGVIKVLEFNARFGDPECLCLWPKLKTDLIPLMKMVADGASIENETVEWADECSVCVVLAHKNYPGKTPGLSLKAEWLDSHPAEGLFVICAGVKKNDDGTYVSTGGRVLDIIAIGKTYEEARERIYKWLANIPADSGFDWRTDIAAQAL